MLKIGIAQSMLYYDFSKFFHKYFTTLGLEVVVSPKTNDNILNEGVLSCVDEACLPVKIFHGHVSYLRDKVDYIFIPRIISSYKREYYCPKQLGLADMAKHSIDNLPKLIDPIMHLDSQRNIKKSLYDLGSFFPLDKNDIKMAIENACRIINKENKKESFSGKNGEINLLIAGHPYIIEDDFINMNIRKKLKNKANLIFSKDFNENDMRESASSIKKRIFWTHGIDIVGSAYYAIENDLLDGIIYLSSFGCGLDSILINLIENKIHGSTIPLLIISLDEQTGEAGFNTRLEAFLDMIDWRWKNENKLSAPR